MSQRWMEKLSAASPSALPLVDCTNRGIAFSQGRLQEYLKATKGGRVKVAQTFDGYWRRLKPGQKGKGQTGEEQTGRTWVHKDRLKPEVKLKAHQIDFAKAVGQMPDASGVIAAHGTGTGKGLVAVSAFEKLKGEGRAKRALVITPAGLRNNFADKTVARFTNSKVQILEQPRQLPENVEYAVVSYDAFRQRPLEYVNAVKPDTIIADEVHRAANPQSKTYKSLMAARQETPRFMGLTASVVQNKPQEIVPLLNLATGGETPLKTEQGFRRMHVTRKPAPQKGIFGGKTYEEKLIRTALLKANVGKTIHYVEDLDASEKPREFVETVHVPMSQGQIQLYRMSMKGIDPVIVEKIKAGVPVSQNQAMQVFTRLLRARQVSNSLNSVVPTMSPAAAAEQTPKIKRILDDAVDHLKKTPDGQIIMYTNLVHGGVDVLEAGLKARGIPYGVFAGRGVPGITEETRQDAVQKYLSGKNRVIVVTGAGAEGLSLGNTTMEQMVDGHYNPERNAQAKARGIRAGGLAHRPPEQRKVLVRRYVSSLPKTFWQKVTFRPPERGVEEWVYATAERKQKLNRQLRDVLAARSEHEKKKRESLLYRIFRGQP